MHPTFSSLPVLASNEYALESSPERLGWLSPVPKEERHQREALWQRLQRDGYLFLKGILNRQQILAFREYYFSALAPSGLLKPGTTPMDGIINPGTIDLPRLKEILFNTIVPGKQYEDLCSSPEIVGFYKWFLDGEIFLHKRKIIRHVPPGKQHATGAHFDLVYLRSGTNKLYTSWIPLGDCPLQRGGLIYLENSHRDIERREQESSQKVIGQWLTRDVAALANQLDTRWLIANYEAGDMVIHTPYLVHASLNNVSPDGTMRLSTDIRYQLTAELIDSRWQNHWHPDDGL